MIPPAILFGFLMAGVDVVGLSLLKMISLGTLKPFIQWMVIPTIVYAFQPWIFVTSLKYESLTIMNLIWDLASDVLVTLTGLLYFKEKVSTKRLIGVVFAFISLALMSGAINGED